MGNKKFLSYLAVAFIASIITSAVVLYFNPDSGLVQKQEVTVFSTINETNLEWVYNEVSPSVVQITTTVLERNYFLQIVPQEGLGSGIVISKKGYILTNYHVIKNADFLRVTLPDGGTTYASLVGADPENDIAVIKINPNGLKLEPVHLGDSSKLKVGQLVLAVGNPFGLDLTASMGIISALNRSISEKNTDTVTNGMIQTDASINPGNSGGPLLNMRGQVIGLNTAILSPNGGNIGIGFAIPINKAKRIAEKLISQESSEKNNQAVLGITGITLDKNYSRALNLPVQSGALIITVFPGSPAYVAGLKGADRNVIIKNKIYPAGGDIIVKVGGTEIKSMEDLTRVISSHSPGDKIEIEFYRGNKLYKTKLKLAARLH